MTRQFNTTMGLRLKEQIYGNCFFVTTTFNNWENYGNIDGVYEKLFELLVLYLKKYKGKLMGYVFMPSHIHLLIEIEGKNLSPFMRDFKKYISQKAFKDIRIDNNKIWMDGFDRVVIYSEVVLLQKLEYIHHNPVKAGFVNNANDWKWSSAQDYSSDKIVNFIVFTNWK